MRGRRKQRHFHTLSHRHAQLARGAAATPCSPRRDRSLGSWILNRSCSCSHPQSSSPNSSPPSDTGSCTCRQDTQPCTWRRRGSGSRNFLPRSGRCIPRLPRIPGRNRRCLRRTDDTWSRPNTERRTSLRRSRTCSSFPGRTCTCSGHRDTLLRRRSRCRLLPCSPRPRPCLPLSRCPSAPPGRRPRSRARSSRHPLRPVSSARSSPRSRKPPPRAHFR